MFRPISDLHTKLFTTFRVFVTYIRCTHSGDFCKWSDCDFSPAICVSKHSCVLLFSARISLTHMLWEDDSFEVSLLLKDQSLTRFLGCFKKRWPTNRFFMHISAFVGNFRDSFFFSWETLRFTVLSLTNILCLWFFKLMIWSRWLLFWVC